MLVDGEASVGGQPLTLFELTVLAPGAAMTLASERGGRVMLLGGEAFATRRHVWWNFVSSDRERIDQAKRDWKDGRFGGAGRRGRVHSLPEKATTVSYP